MILLIFSSVILMSMSQDCCAVSQQNKTCPANNYLWCTSCQNNQCVQECKTCNNLISNCAQCDCIKFLCSNCNNGYEVSNLATQCKALTFIAQIAPCNGTTLKCQDGYYYDVSKTCACQKCFLNCLKCFNSQSCELCAPDTYIHTGLLYQDSLVCYRDKFDLLIGVDTNKSTLNLGAGWNHKKCAENSINLAYGARCLTYDEMCIVEKYCKVVYGFSSILSLVVLIYIS